MAWPTNNDNLPANHVDGVDELILALHVNRLDSAVNALQAELGNLPKGSYSSVKARLDATAGALPPNPADRDLLTIASDGSTRWSVKAAPYNVCEEPGVDPTGVTPCGAAVQAAINKAAAANGELLVPPGDYKLDAASTDSGGSSHVQVWPSNLKMRGIAGRSKFTVASNVGPMETFINQDTTNGNNDILIENLEVDLNKGGRGFFGGGACWTTRINGNTGLTKFCANIVWRNIHLHDSPSLGMAFRHVNGGRMEDLVVHDNDRDGIGVYTNSRDIFITHPRVYRCGDDLIAAHSQQDEGFTTAVVRNLVITNPILSAGVIASTNNGGNGINLTGVQRGTILGGIVDTPWHNGLHLRNNQNQACTDISVIGTEFTASGIGHSPTGADNGIMMSVEDTGFYGGVASAPIQNVRLVGVSVTSPNDHGILIRGSTARATRVQWVKVIGGDLVGFNTSNTGRGIYCQNDMAQGIQVIGGTIRDWRHRGIDFVGGARVRVADVSVFSNGSGTGGLAGIAMGATNGYGVHDCHSTDLGAVGSKTQAYGFDWGTSLNGKVHGNDFQGNATGGVIGTKASTDKEWMNVDNGGTLRTGDAGTAGMLT